MVYKEYKNHTYQTKKKLDDRKFCMNEKKKSLNQQYVTCQVKVKVKPEPTRKKNLNVYYTQQQLVFSLWFLDDKKKVTNIERREKNSLLLPFIRFSHLSINVTHTNT